MDHSEGKIDAPTSPIDHYSPIKAPKGVNSRHIGIKSIQWLL